MRRTLVPALVLTALAAACGERVAGPGPAAPASTQAAGAASPASSSSERVDPRSGGLAVGLGEWAVTPEAGAIRPGRVTFVVTNRGTIAHGFEIEADAGDSSGPGNGDGLKAETSLLAPGETTRLTLDLAPGVYKIECLVQGHDDLGMEGFLRVRPGAPLAAGDAGSPSDVTVRGFAFAPARLEVAPGATVTWTNADPTEHTVTAGGGLFDSGALGNGEAFSFTFRRPGSYPYACSIHPEMGGAVIVRG